MANFFCVLARVSVLARIAALAAIAFGFAAPVSLAAVSPVEKRVALVIGNGAYENAVRLDNAVFDARAVADGFRKLGFQVVDGYDLDIDHMRAKVSEFSAALSDSKSAVIYYAGHGISVDEENYLIPTDISLKSPTDLDLNAISVSLLLKQMKRDDRVNIVILDACRDNPFAATLAKQKTRALVVERGLTRIDGDLARGTLIAFASDPKSSALDGQTGQHSPFTEAFLTHLFDSGVTIDTVMSRVRNDVWEKTGHHQLPWVNTSLIGEYELNPQLAPEPTAESTKPSATPETLSDARRAQENLLWESAQHSNLGADYQAYLSAFPDGVFAQMAKNRIASMESASTSAPTSAPQTLAMREPTGPKDEELRDNVGTVDTEQALKLGPAGEKEVQQRLNALDLYKGPVTGALDQATRSALAEWQKKRGFAPTSFLDSAQLAALRADSETEYQKYLAAQPAPQPAAAEAPRRALAKPSPKPPVVRAAKPPAPAAPARRVVKRTNPNRPETADQAAPPPPPPIFLGGSPAWRRRAGLPELPTDPGLGRRPPGFWTGSSGGLLLGGVRHY
jgi:uncharacterized caspase-like protein